MSDLRFEHVYRPSADPVALTLLLLHGTGGNEYDLLPIGEMIAPHAGVLSPRGRVLEGTMPRFFKRHGEGVFDLDDLRLQTRELAGFVSAASTHYHFDPARVIAVGFSNGANVAASLLLLESRGPERSALEGAILFRAMVPIVPDTLPDLSGVRILMSNGRLDSLVAATQAEQLQDMFEDCGADVTFVWQAGGHNLTNQDITAAREWMSTGDW